MRTTVCILIKVNSRVTSRNRTGTSPFTAVRADHYNYSHQKRVCEEDRTLTLSFTGMHADHYTTHTIKQIAQESNPAQKIWSLRDVPSISDLSIYIHVSQRLQHGTKKLTQRSQKIPKASFHKWTGWESNPPQIACKAFSPPWYMPAHYG